MIDFRGLIYTGVINRLPAAFAGLPNAGRRLRTHLPAGDNCGRLQAIIALSCPLPLRPFRRRRRTDGAADVYDLHRVQVSPAHVCLLIVIVVFDTFSGFGPALFRHLRSADCSGTAIYRG